MPEKKELDFTGKLNFGDVILEDPPGYDIVFDTPVEGTSYLCVTGGQLLQSADDEGKATMREQFNKQATVEVQGTMEIVAPDNGGSPYKRLASIKKVTPRPQTD